MCGKGIDRHLFCLYVVSKYLEVDSPFLKVLGKIFQKQFKSKIVEKKREKSFEQKIVLKKRKLFRKS